MVAHLALSSLVALSALASEKQRDVTTASRQSQPCGDLLFENGFLHDRMPSEPRDSEDPFGFVTDAFPLNVDTMIRSYSAGLYALQESDDRLGNVELVSPRSRGIIELDPSDPFKGISSRNQRIIRSLRARGYTVKFDHRFESVLTACQAQVRPKRALVRTAGRASGWITERFRNVLIELHVLGLAHSVEVYFANQLVAGLVGTSIGGVFSGESMFFVRGIGDDATKLALFELRRRLSLKGHTIIDTQETNDLIRRMGGRTVSRETFRELRLRQSTLNPQF